MTNLPPETGPSPRARRLASIASMLATAPTVRAELVADIRRQMAEGSYMSEEKLDLAIGRMLRDILG